MVCFKYDLNQDIVELKASNWNGFERLFINGEKVSSKFNFGPTSEHKVELTNGINCRFQLMIDPQTEQLMCRIYKQNKLVASLKQGSKNLLETRRLFSQTSAIVGSVVLLLIYWI